MSPKTSKQSRNIAPLPPPPPEIKLDRIKLPKDVGGVVAAVDTVVQWAIEHGSGIGYFATMQKRIAIAVEKAINDNEFQDADRMRELTLTFVGRYFTALNAYFHPADYERPTTAWQWSFDSVTYDEPIIIQHVLTGMCAHINLDLGIATADVGKSKLAALKHDFDVVNAVLASQVKPVMKVLGEISPRVKWVAGLPTVDEEAIVSKLIVAFRNLAWSFAENIQEQPHKLRELVDEQGAWTNLWGTKFIYPPEPFPRLVQWIAEHEKREIGANVRKFDVPIEQIEQIGLNPVFLRALQA